MKITKIIMLAALPLALFIWLANVQSWRPRTLEAHNSPVHAIAFSPDGKMLASCGKGQDVMLWDIKAKKILHTLSASPGEAKSVAFSPDSKMIAAALELSNDMKSEVRLWDTKTGMLERIWSQSRGMTGVAFSQDGKTLAGSGYISVTLWNVETGQERQTVSIGDTFWVTGVALSPDAKIVIGLGESDQIYWWDTEKALRDENYYGEGKLIRGLSATFSPDGKLLAVGGDRQIDLYDVNTGQTTRKLTGNILVVNAVAFSFDGKILASVDDTKIRLWDVQTGKLLRTMEGHGNRYFSSILA